MMTASSIALAASAYVAGAIPSGYLLAKKTAGIDIRTRGTGNPGAANVYRMVGPSAGLWTFFFDALKGYLPVLAAERLSPEQPWLAVLCGACAVIGHVWTVFLGGRGGKGVATSAGVFLALLPVPALAAMAVFFTAMKLSRHISVGSMSAALALPVFAACVRAPEPALLLACALGALVLARHIPNLLCLLRGLPLSSLKKQQPIEEKVCHG
ncbi:MAG: glycerol-3-phosphate acyltransferase [Elusimicrobiota bacterium]|jgi:glycerol-3-phosphate acyltransferase PlsY